MGEFVLALLLALGFQRTPQAAWGGGGCLTRPSPSVRVRLGGVTLWRRQGTTCQAVVTVLPPFVLRSRARPPDVARNAWLATPGGLSVERWAVSGHLSPMARYRLVGAFGHQRLVAVLTRGGLPLPASFRTDAQPSHGLTTQVDLPPMVSGRVIWHLGDTKAASAAAWTQSDGEFQRAAFPQEPAYRVRGLLRDGYDSPINSVRTLFPGARLGHGLRHAINQLPGKLAALAAPVRTALRAPF